MERDTSIIQRELQKNASKRNFSLFLVDILIEHDEYIDISQITSADLKTHK